MTLEEAIKKIQPLDEEAMEYTRARWKTRRNGDTVRWNLPR